MAFTDVDREELEAAVDASRAAQEINKKKQQLVDSGAITQDEADSLSVEAIEEAYLQLSASGESDQSVQPFDIQFSSDGPEEVIINGVYVSNSTNPPNVAGASPTASSTTEEEPSVEEQATDQRLEAQGILVDFISEIGEKNYDWRNSENNKGDVFDLTRACGGGGTFNTNMIGMFGDGEIFSSLINGSELKSRFLDFTTAQLSSITPVIQLIKSELKDDGKYIDYSVPFPTHTAWYNSSANSGRLLKNDSRTNLNSYVDNTAPLNVGLKSFNWQYEGSNPVSAKVDIKAEMVLVARGLTDLLEYFDIYNINPTQDENKQSMKFRYIDLILRDKFDPAKSYDPSYYRIKMQVGWKTENTKLFTKEQLDSLKANTTTLILTLLDHKFEFDQDGSVKLTLNYRAYYETLMASQKADFLRTKETQEVIDMFRQELYVASNILNSEDSIESEKEQAKKIYDKRTQDFNNQILSLNKESFKSIIDELQRKQAIYYIQVNNAAYVAANSSYYQESYSGINIINYKPEQSTIAQAAIDAVNAVDAENKTNDKLTSFVPKTEEGKKNISFFYLGDLFAIAIKRMYDKMEGIERPNFLFGSVAYVTPQSPVTMRYTNILDIPVSVEWFTEWFTSEVISQNKELYPLLYFIRDLSSNLINQLVGRRDDSGSLKNRNVLNTLNFNIKNINKTNNFNNLDALMESKFLPDPLNIINQNINQNFGVLPATDLLAENVGEIVNKFVPQYGETDNIQEYVAIYCQDRRTPAKVVCEEDIKKGRYHFYFGRDRGLVKKINFTKLQTTGLRELNYVRQMNGTGLEQLTTPYDVEMIMVGNNLLYNGMMIYINPSGFGRKIGQPDDENSDSYKLKLGGYHFIYRVENSLGTDGFETRVKARWVGAGLPPRNNGSGNVYGSGVAPVTEPVKKR